MACNPPSSSEEGGGDGVEILEKSPLGGRRSEILMLGWGKGVGGSRTRNFEVKIKIA